MLRAGAPRRCSFLILNACPAVPFLAAESYALECVGVDPRSVQKLFDRLQSAARAGADVRTANRLLAESEDARLHEVLDHAGFTLDEPRWAQLRGWIDYTPALDLRRLAVPTLVVYGAQDPLTPIDASLSALAQLAPSAQVRLFADADHRVQIDDQLAPGYLETITACRRPDA